MPLAIDGFPFKRCQDCGFPVPLRDLNWHCERCGWDNAEMIREKVREQLANDPSAYE